MNADRFMGLAGAVSELIPAGWGFTLLASGEQSDFVRFNHAKVRQPGSVSQGTASLRLIDGSRHASTEFTLSGSDDVDNQRLSDAVANLSALVPEVPEDPHLLLATDVHSTHQVTELTVPSPEEVVGAVCDEAADTDLVGIYAGGTLWRGFANHLGQRNWFESGGLLLDYSLVHGADKAVKSSLAGSSWSREAVSESVAAAKIQLAALDRPSRRIEPGTYRAWLAPSAVAELLETMVQDGFSARAHKHGSSCLQKLGERSMNPMFTLLEDTANGLGPAFQSDGFIKPAQVSLVREGQLAGTLISPRSAAEYGLTQNGASAWESPSSLAMAPGDLPSAEALKALGTGVWVSNLWYLNHSDKNAGRVTGMTRFATFWVEDGELVAPLDVMRFDASLYRLFGEDLEAIGAETAFLPSAATYGERSTDSVRVPGMLVSALPFTL